MTRPARAVGGRRVAVSNPEKPLYPSGFTKAEVVDYYLNVAAVMLPHLKGRAVTLKRYPDGTGGLFFFEKNCPAHRPDWVKTAAVRGGAARRSSTACWKTRQPGVGGEPGGAGTACAAGKGGCPGPADGDGVRPGPRPAGGAVRLLRIGLRLRDVLAGVGLDCYAKTSGGKGLHVYVPLNTPATFEQTKAFARRSRSCSSVTTPGRSRRR